MNGVGMYEVRYAIEYKHYFMKGMIALPLIVLSMEIIECSIHTYTERK